MKVFCFFLLCFINANLFGQFDHISVSSDLEGEQLRSALVDDFKPQSVLELREARDTLYAEVHLHLDSVRCVYTSHSLFLTPGVDPSQDLFGSGGSTDLNLEHSYPQAKGSDAGAANSDMHHLFPTRVIVNSARGNDPMVELSDNEVVRWFYRAETRTSTPPGDLSLWARDADVAFEPQDDFKGNIARAYFYFYTMYRSEADTADPDFFELQRETLCEWHDFDPVDSLEWVRTFKIADFQDDKPNPFVLDCSLARLYCSDIAAACRLVGTAEESDKKARLFPNPCQSGQQVSLDISDKIISVTLINMRGQKQEVNLVSNRITAPEQAGSYTLVIHTEEGVVRQRLVVL